MSAEKLLHFHVVFIVDTSLSMNAVDAAGGVRISKLDLAKGFVESFVEASRKSFWRHGWRYLLVAYDRDEPIKATFGDTTETVLGAAKALRANGLLDASGALRAAFEHLNLERWSRDVDTPGFGRYILKSEPTLVFWLTDGARLPLVQSSQPLAIAPLPDFGLPLYDRPFRWDQRVVSVLIGSAVDPVALSECRRLADETGGDVFNICRWREAKGTAERIVGKQRLSFPGLDLAPSAPLVKQCAMVRMQTLHAAPDGVADEPALVALLLRLTGQYLGQVPMPEAAWPAAHVEGAVLRGDPIPTLLFDAQHPISPQFELPAHTMMDEVVVDPGSWVCSALERQCPPATDATVRLAVFLRNQAAGGDPLGPFGLVQYSRATGATVLQILPYRWPELFALVNELSPRERRMPVPPRPWLEKLQAYVRGIPHYYISALKKQFERWGLVHIVRNAQHPLPPGATFAARFETKIGGIKVLAAQQLEARARAVAERTRVALAATTAGPVVGALRKQIRMGLRLPADVTGRDAADEAHALPIARMGDYSGAVKALRIADEPEHVTAWKATHFCGNPYQFDDLWSWARRPRSPGPGKDLGAPATPPLSPVDAAMDSQVDEALVSPPPSPPPPGFSDAPPGFSDAESDAGALDTAIDPAMLGGRRRPRRMRHVTAHFPARRRSLLQRVPRLADAVVLAPGFVLPTCQGDLVCAPGASDGATPVNDGPEALQMRMSAALDSLFDGSLARELAAQLRIRKGILRAGQRDPMDEAFAAALTDNHVGFKEEANADTSSDSATSGQTPESPQEKAAFDGKPTQTPKKIVTASDGLMLTLVAASPTAASRTADRYELEQQRGWPSPVAAGDGSDPRLGGGTANAASPTSARPADAAAAFADEMCSDPGIETAECEIDFNTQYHFSSAVPTWPPEGVSRHESLELASEDAATFAANARFDAGIMDSQSQRGTKRKSPPSDSPASTPPAGNPPPASNPPLAVDGWKARATNVLQGDGPVQQRAMELLTDMLNTAELSDADKGVLFQHLEAEARRYGKSDVLAFLGQLQSL